MDYPFITFNCNVLVFNKYIFFEKKFIIKSDFKLKYIRLRSQNNYVTKIFNRSLPFTKKYDYCDCIVIGSGIAGLSTAIRISEHTCVKVITKSNLSESTTWYAQGGIAAVIKKPDEWKSHYEDTIIAGQGLSDSNAVLKLVKTAPKMIEDLFELGIIFDISGGEISLTTEGGHSFPRVLHAGGDATGEEIEKKLVKYSKTFSKIKFFPEYLAVDIITL